MAKYAYLIFNVMTFLSSLVILQRSQTWPQLNKKALLITFLLVCGPFILWDIYATSQGHWGFNPAYVTGVAFFGVPIEEWLFFLSVPLVCLSVYLACAKSVRGPLAHFGLLPLGLFTAALLVLASQIGGAYTQIVSVAVMFVWICSSFFLDLLVSKSFWVFMAISFGLFFAANTFLTALPIVTYGETAIIGLRIGTIPIEDFAYNFVLLTFFIAVYEKLNYKK